MKQLSKKALRGLWRTVIKPLVRMLPPSKSDQIETLVHYTKLTLVGGHTIPFRALEAHTKHEVVPTPTIAPEVAEQLIVGDEPTETPATVVEAAADVDDAAIVPSWAIDEMRELADIEPSLYPTPDLLWSFQRYVTPARPGAGNLYAACYPGVRDAQPDLIILAPWLKHGGADQGILHHADAAVAAGKSVVVITTLDAESPWASRLPKGAHFLPLGTMASALPYDEQLAVLTRILLQSSAKTIHLINSPLGWDVVRYHGKSLRALGKSIFASVFCDDYDANGVRWSYAQLYFPSCLPYLDGVFCDTEYYPRELVRRYGARRDLFHTLYFPHAVTAAPRYRAGPNRSVLWAGRFSRQKRVDLLDEIAKAMPDVHFEVHGCGMTTEEKAVAKRLRALSNVTVNGPFESLDRIAGEGQHGAFLYTSAWDGLPIVLLDATAAGLPIVASAVGGVGEFISDVTGVPVRSGDGVEGYVRGLSVLLDQPEEGRARWQRAVNLLAQRHAGALFRSAVERIPGYLQ
ncbi:glycosyltransferase family 4 protein [Cupriavidus gilardii]|uniref:glycosyltransferase family 4 protein n=1 Tax=Cupriavidus gilardii TaxID=82541 RepID=UPI001EE50E3C|nr:glycosyltransferase family 4 protein [Cupriavidus gilardii]